MEKVITLTELDITKLVKRVIAESQEFQMAIDKVMELSSELGEPIGPEEAKTVCGCSFEDIKPEPNIDSKAMKIFNEVKNKIKEMILKKDRNGLKKEFKKLVNEIRMAKNAKKDSTSQEKQVNEQVSMTAAVVIFGITAELWIWLIIGGFLLILIIKAIVALSSWIPRTSGHGCGRVKIIRVR
jgi:hypothetical protein